MSTAARVDAAREALLRFARASSPASVRLAMHAAVPQTFRPELVHLLRLNFVPEAAREGSVAESDVLLAGFCVPLGGDFFRFEPEARRQLLDHLVATYASEQPSRIRRVAAMLLAYLDQAERRPSGRGSLLGDYFEVERWVAAAFFSPEETATQFARELAAATAERRHGVSLQLGGIAPAVELPLSRYPELLAYAQAVAAIEQGNEDRAQLLVDALPSAGIDVGGVKLETLRRGAKSAQPGPGSNVAPPEVAPSEASGSTRARPGRKLRDLHFSKLDVPAVSASAEPVVTGDENPAIAELRARIAAGEPNRDPDVLVELADLLADPSERVQYYLQAAALWQTRFVNQEQALRAYERVLELAPNHQQARSFARERYEKRRDWEKLLALDVREAEMLPEGPERAQRFKASAMLATERVKKPAVATALWEAVLQNDPADLDALSQLNSLYVRSGDYAKLAEVLAKEAELVDDPTAKVTLLNRLAEIVSDRVHDEARAVELYRTILALQPDDRRAQERLKKSYLALGQWDDLEAFYAENGKWDEFIRVLESKAAKETDDHERAALFSRIGDLWWTQKEKPDRAARAYESVIKLEPDNLEVIDKLTSIYIDTSNWRGLQEMYELKSALLPDSSEKHEMLRTLAVSYETSAKDKAFETYLSAFQIEPGDTATQADFERLADATGRWDTVISAYRAAIVSLSNENVEQASLRLRLAQVLERASRPTEALEEYHALLSLDGNNAAARDAIERLEHTLVR